MQLVSRLLKAVALATEHNDWGGNGNGKGARTGNWTLFYGAEIHIITMKSNSIFKI
jgi:hypothetical protein